jgi:hypothetical protein
MARLEGRNTRTVFTNLEIVSDDGMRVISIETSAECTHLFERDANNNPYGWQNRVKYTLDPDQRALVAKAISPVDVSYERKEIEKISSTRFQIPQPEPEVIEEENCSPIAIADAQAAAALVAKEARIEAVKFELRLDHTRDKHWSADVEGCPLCDAKIIPQRAANKIPPATNYIDLPEDDPENDIAPHSLFPEDGNDTYTPAKFNAAGEEILPF